LLYNGYVLADSIYQNWKAIRQLYHEHQDSNLNKTAASTGMDIAKNVLSSVLTDVAWEGICNIIPKNRQNESKAVLTEVIYNVTASEIDFAKRFLREQEKGKSKRSKIAGKQGILDKDRLPEHPKWPPETDYV
jgi:hypothetical protein